MSKQFAQIAFDFSAMQEEEAKSTATDTVISETEKSIPEIDDAVIGVPVTNEAAIIDITPVEEKKPIKIKKTAQPVIKTSPTKKQGQRGRYALKDFDDAADYVQIPPDEELFQKQYYSIGQVAEWFQLNQSLIRFWETEFDILQPRKNRKGDRFFRPVDVKNLVMIYDLLRKRKFTIEGAKDYLKKNKKAEEKFAMIQSLEKIKGFLLELKASLG